MLQDARDIFVKHPECADTDPNQQGRLQQLEQCDQPD
jgi:hypothetical protein